MSGKYLSSARGPVGGRLRALRRRLCPPRTGPLPRRAAVRLPRADRLRVPGKPRRSNASSNWQRPPRSSATCGGSAASAGLDLRIADSRRRHADAIEAQRQQSLAARAHWLSQNMDALRAGHGPHTDRHAVGGGFGPFRAASAGSASGSSSARTLRVPSPKDCVAPGRGFNDVAVLWPSEPPHAVRGTKISDSALAAGLGFQSVVAPGRRTAIAVRRRWECVLWLSLHRDGDWLPMFRRAMAGPPRLVWRRVVALLDDEGSMPKEVLDRQLEPAERQRRIALRLRRAAPAVRRGTHPCDPPDGTPSPVRVSRADMATRGTLAATDVAYAARARRSGVDLIHPAPPGRRVRRNWQRSRWRGCWIARCSAPVATTVFSGVRHGVRTVGVRQRSDAHPVARTAIAGAVGPVGVLRTLRRTAAVFVLRGPRQLPQDATDKLDVPAQLAMDSRKSLGLAPCLGASCASRGLVRANGGRMLASGRIVIGWPRSMCRSCARSRNGQWRALSRQECDAVLLRQGTLVRHHQDRGAVPRRN